MGRSPASRGEALLLGGGWDSGLHPCPGPEASPPLLLAPAVPLMPPRSPAACPGASRFSTRCACTFFVFHSCLRLLLSGRFPAHTELDSTRAGEQVWGPLQVWSPARCVQPLLSGMPPIPAPRPPQLPVSAAPTGSRAGLYFFPWAGPGTGSRWSLKRPRTAQEFLRNTEREGPGSDIKLDCKATVTKADQHQHQHSGQLFRWPVNPRSGR